jgi:hypothetical protein
VPKGFQGSYLDYLLTVAGVPGRPETAEAILRPGMPWRD